ncbi:MAG: allophanate hydrolase [Ideonella sp.]|nr:allophanate hydrolase [Ideonella sp.]
MPQDTPFTIAEWRAACATPGASLREVLAPVLARREPGDPAWILPCDQAFMDAQFERLAPLVRSGLPLYGVPFAVKDNIDVAGLPTTAACPAFSYRPATSATVVQRLMAAGAVLVGKTNLDQFATGLVGTRSPHGEVPNPFDARHVSGGSSSGSASVVARGLAAFALGTDTAGSGRVPAGLNNLVGLKPTPGRVPMAGVLPACRSLDVVSVLALTVADAAEVMAVIEGAQGEPAFQHHALRPAWLGACGRPLRVGVPSLPACDAALGFDLAFEEAVAQWRAWGLQAQPIDMQPLFDVAGLLYDGPWVAERYAVVKALIERDPQALDATVRTVIEGARQHDAVSAFEARYLLEDLRLRIAPLWQLIDVLMVPTVPTCPTRAAVAKSPVLRNSELGRFTNFVNLLGMAALAVPSGFTPSGLPFGVTLLAPGGSDAALGDLGLRWATARALPLGCHLRAPQPADAMPLARPAAADSLEIAVVGAHLQGMPLHGQLQDRHCRLVARTTTAPAYRLYALPGTTPPKPGLARVSDAPGTTPGGHCIDVELYEMPAEAVGSFLALIPPPLGLGSLQLADGRWVKGFICEPAALVGATDISAFGGWRAYLCSR